MTPLEDSPDRLVLRDRPGFVAAALVACGLVCFVMAMQTDAGDWQAQAGRVAVGVFAIAVAWVVYPTRTLVFDRASGLLVVETRRVGRVVTDVIPLSRIRRASVQADHDGDIRTERLVVLTAEGPVPLEMSYTSDARLDVSRRINQWLGVPTPPPGARSEHA